MTSSKESFKNNLVSLAIDDQGIVTIQMKDTAGKNKLSDPFMKALTERLEEAKGMKDAKVVILTGMPDVFCAGADESLLKNLNGGPFSPAELTFPRNLLDVPVPMIAAVEGHAVAGGLCLAACSDIVILAQESRYGASFMNMGFTPGVGLTRLLDPLFGAPLAHEMLLTGELFKGSHFVGRGNVNYVLPKGEVLAKAHAIAARIAEKPKTSLEILKRTLSTGKRAAFEEARNAETLMHEITFKLPEVAKGIKDYFENFES